MKLTQSKNDSFSLLSAILFLILGIILISNPGGVIKFITYIIGGILLILGIAKLFFYYKNKNNEIITNNVNNLTLGILFMVIGIIIMFCSSAIEFIIRLIMGGWLLYNGIIKLMLSFKLKENNVSTWYVPLVASIIMIACGLYIVIKSNLIFSAVGIVLVIYSIIEIIQYVVIPKSKNPDIIK